MDCYQDCFQVLDEIDLVEHTHSEIECDRCSETFCWTCAASSNTHLPYVKADERGSECPHCGGWVSS